MPADGAASHIFVPSGLIPRKNYPDAHTRSNSLVVHWLVVCAKTAVADRHTHAKHRLINNFMKSSSIVSSPALFIYAISNIRKR